MRLARGAILVGAAPVANCQFFRRLRPAPGPFARLPPRGPLGRRPGFPPGGMTSGDHWISALDEAGCAPGVSLVEMGGPILSMPTVGSGGGYGGFYCFSLTP